MPDAVFVIDTRKEAIAVAEARKLKIPVIGVVDTNCDPDEVDVPIPGNDDALRAIRLFAGKVADAVLAGRGLREAQRAEAVAGGGRARARPPHRPPGADPGRPDGLTYPGTASAPADVARRRGAAERPPGLSTNGIDRGRRTHMSISAEVVRQLREETGAGMMDCKSALVEAQGDMDAGPRPAAQEGPRRRGQEGRPRRHRRRGRLLHPRRGGRSG